MKNVLEKLIQGYHLSEEEAEGAMKCIMSGTATSAQIGGFLTAMRIKGETIDEITGFARGMRSFSRKVDVQNGDLVDTCGTGGDGANTFNISTASAIITAAAGVPVAKHGNRAASSKTGSADVLAALGVNIELEPQEAALCLQEVGLCFMFAVQYHESMRHAIGPRRELGYRTVFNMLGPLTNPAGAKRQVIGTYSPDIVEKMAHVLRRLGSHHVMVVHGKDGLDEITVTGSTIVAELKNGAITQYEISPADVGLSVHDASTIKGGHAEENADIIRATFAGARGGARDIVLFNAGASLYVGGKAATLREGVQIASEMIDSGKALSTLSRLVEVSNRFKKETVA